MKTSVVVTSISGPNPVMQRISEGCQSNGWDFIVAGDRKTPSDFALEGCTFLSLEAQQDSPFRTGGLCPQNSYVRKNMAYLHAIHSGAELILETDDDNLPLEAFWRRRARKVPARRVAGQGWVNVYAFFSEEMIYPRGFPLDLARNSMRDRMLPTSQTVAVCPIQQGLAGGAPDVDAVYRMLHGEETFFHGGDPVVLGRAAHCPFNSQNTAFFREVFPLLYLPAHCSFRATDIWRGLVAQRLLSTCDWSLSFHEADVHQDRNPHDLMNDFHQEVPVYLQTRQVVEILQSLNLEPGPSSLTANLRTCYEALARAGIVGGGEPDLVEAWITDLDAAGWSVG
jgi:hypothetical protein